MAARKTAAATPARAKTKPAAGSKSKPTAAGPKSKASKAARDAEARDERATRTEQSIELARKAAADAAKVGKARKVADPPPGLPDIFRSVWALARAELVKHGLWNEVARPQLDQYVRALEGAHQARAAAQAEPFVEGSMGQLVSHPGFSQAEACERQALSIAKELLLTPASRRRAGINDEGEKTDELEEILRALQD